MMYETGDLTDREFGGLKVLWLNKKSQNGSASWLCRCTCGRLCTAGGIALVKGRRTNCGECNYGRYSVVDGHMECTLPTGGRFRIDCEDYALVAQYRWTMNAAGYFVASLGRKSNHIFLHRLIMNPPDGLYVDHIDGDKSNCQRSNMRLCSYTENNRNVGLQQNNQCGYKGVYWASDRGKWRAEITVDRKHIHIGSFDSPIDAAEAYDEAAILYFGEYAKTNKMLGLINKEMDLKGGIQNEEILELDSQRSRRQGTSAGGTCR